MNECCANCKYNVKLETWDYRRKDGVWKMFEDGFVCTLFASEGTVIHMLGVDEDKGMCECFIPRKEKNNG